MEQKMGLFRRNKISDSDIKYIATARALLERCLDVDESNNLCKNLNLSDSEFSDFHVNKRFLALKTVTYTAVISMEPEKRIKFVEIFIREKDARENIKAAPKNVQKMLRLMDEAHDGAYHSVFEKVTNYIQNNQCDPIEVLCEAFSRTFCSFLEQESSEVYMNIGKTVFYKHHNLAMEFLPKIEN